MAAVTNSAPQVGSKSPTIRRILREAAEISNSPSPDYSAEPLESDLFEWHFTLKGPPNSVYSDGVYHGRIVLPPTYPLRPPSFRFTTPNGRFEANREICLSISGHHEETWQPAWGIRTALVALRSFMETDAKGQLGGLDTTDEVRRRLARESGSYTCSACSQSNADIIAETAARATDLTLANTGPATIPQELTMGWRDELETKPSSNSSKENGRGNGNDKDDESDSADLAEGFVATGPENQRELFAASEQPVATDVGGHGSQYPARQQQTSPPNRTIAAPAQQTTRQNGAMHVHGDGVPLWIDRAIVALVIALAALLLKVLFGV